MKNAKQVTSKSSVDQTKVQDIQDYIADLELELVSTMDGVASVYMERAKAATQEDKDELDKVVSAYQTNLGSLLAAISAQGFSIEGVKLALLSA